MDKFKGDSRYVKNINNMPSFACYYMGNSFGTFASANDRDIENNIRSGEQYVMTNNNLKNSTGNQMMGQQQPITIPQQNQLLPQQLPINTMSTMNTMNTIPIMNQNQTQPINNTILPTFQQMQQMFQIFQMMQKMGILNIPDTVTVDESNKNKLPQHFNLNEQNTNEQNDTIILPNGDKIYPLSNGQYRYVKNPL